MPDRQSPLLLDRIGKNELVETWLAQWPDSPQKLLLKKPSARDGDELTAANTTLAEVFSQTRDFRHRNILPPRRSLQVEDRVVLIRNYLQNAATLDSNLLEKHLPALLLQIFSAVDFIHALGLVHTDLQMGNMLVLPRNSSPRLVLTDLDFIRPIASRAEASITGVPGFIAPEVYTEKVLLPQSDFYSLGVMLRELIVTKSNKSTGRGQRLPGTFSLEYLPKLDAESVRQSFRPLVPLVNRLLEPRYQERPAWLGELVEEHQSVFGWNFAAYKRKLFWSLAETAASRVSRNNGHGRLRLSEAIAGELDAQGFNHELFRDIERGWSGDLLELNRLYQRILQSSEIERHGYSWRLDLSDMQAAEIYRLYHLVPILTETLAGGLSPRQLMKTAIRLKADREFYKSYLIFRQLLDSTAFDSLSPSLQTAVLTKLGYVCLALGRSDEGRGHFEKALQSKSVHPRKAVALIAEISSIFNRGTNTAEAISHARQACHIARCSGDVRLRLSALRMLLWTRYMRYGEQRVAWKTRVLFDYAERHGFSSAVKQLGNNVAAVLWSQGKYREETAFVEKLLAKYEFLSSEQIQISLYTNLGQSYGDRSQFGKAISAFRKAQSLSASDTNWGRQGYAHSSLIAAYTASSKFRLALAEAETLYEKSTRWADRLARTTYNINMGQILLARGQLKSALRYLKLGEELARVNHARFERTSALLFLTRGYRWHGDIESLKRDLPRLRALMPTAVDWRLNLHVDLSELWLEAHETGNLRVDRVRALIKEAARHERALEYAEGLFLLAEFGHDREAFKMRNHSKEIWKIFRKKRAPRYAGFYYLIRALSGKAEKDTTYRLNQLNRAVDCFRNAEARYHASVVALRLIRCYREASAMTRAQNVLNWARVSTEPLDNHLLEAELDQEGDLIRKIVGPDTTNMTLLSRIGDVLTSLHNYRRTLEILLRNAVNLTGAERGAIVLTHSDETGLKVEISHACDEVSEKDILKISNSSISRTLEREAGLIVHDAQRDKLTSGFKSVKMHNIVSIACVPLKVRGRLLGALYLDHRSIPALFGEKNYEVIEALAKFMAVAIEIARDVKRGDAERSYAAEKLESLGASVGFLAVDNRSRGVLAQIPKIASFDTTVLLQGESGTGKGLLAEAIHNQSRRSHGPFIALNCSHLRGENGMYELFGVSERAFTGVSAREGRIERADGGTLFLDEIADMPMETQAILLDVIESKKIMRSGSTEQISVDFRLICATNANLEALAARNRFRSDLFYRISAFVIRVPPLRERSDDIEPLVKHLLSVLPGSAPNLSYTRRFIDALKAYEWPGNVRELRNEIERVLILRNGSRLDFDLLNPAIARSSDKLGSTALDKHLEKVERDLIESALKRTNGNVTAAALILRLAPSTLRSRLQKLGIDPDQFKIN